ncbi:MAG: LacI family DNA-binding transcriptional regulator [Spirochaetales bacterium]|nr:LacI family DNA-binding transcriptional regulator [Spirochaetales bacterium]
MSIGKKKPTIYDVAKEAGVSISTVSRVLNKNYPVSKNLVNAVETAVRKLDFFSSPTARRLSGKKSNSIGIVIMYPPDFIFTDYNSISTIRGIDSFAEKKQMDLIIYANWNYRSLNKIRSKRSVDGIIIIGAQIVDSFISELEVAKQWEDFPIVMVNHHRYWKALPEVAADHQKGSYNAIKYLIEMGHKDIVYICHNKRLPSIQYSVKGFKQAFIENSYKFNEEKQIIRINTDSHYALGELAVDKLLKLVPRPTAFMTHDDTIAVDMIRILGERGIIVPRDISCIGAGDFPIATEIKPKLTTKKIDGFKRGYLSAEILLRLINHEQIKSKRILLPATLIKRETVQKPSILE